MNCWEITDVDLNHWVAGARFFGTEDGKYFVIDADLSPAPDWAQKVIRRNTAVFYCSETAGVTDLNADFEFGPETTPEQAVAMMGYILVAAPALNS